VKRRKKIRDHHIEGISRYIPFLQAIQALHDLPVLLLLSDAKLIKACLQIGKAGHGMDFGLWGWSIHGPELITDRANTRPKTKF
jgi:hypothetical protein